MSQNLYEIVECEQQYINQDDARVTVSFSVSSHDWNLLKTSRTWCQFERLLQAFQKKYRKDSCIHNGKDTKGVIW